MAKKIYLDKKECTGCGLCSQIAPNVFQLNDEGVAEITDPEGASEDTIQQAIDECPVKCIHREEE